MVLKANKAEHEEEGGQVALLGVEAQFIQPAKR